MSKETIVKVTLRKRTYEEKEEVRKMRNNSYINMNPHPETKGTFEYNKPKGG